MSRLRVRITREAQYAPRNKAKHLVASSAATTVETRMYQLMLQHKSLTQIAL